MGKQNNPNPNQRHGRLGQVKLNPDGTVDEKAEKKRLYQNQKSREARARRKLLAQAQDAFVENPELKCDNGESMRKMKQDIKDVVQVVFITLCHMLR